MRGARLFLPMLLAFAAAACSRSPQPTYYVVDPNTGQPVAVMQQPMVQPAAPVYAQAPQYAQPQYAQAPAAQTTPGRGLYQPGMYAQQQPMLQPQASTSSERGLFSSSRPAQVYTQPQYAQPSSVIQYGGGTGGPYVQAAPYGYASATPYQAGYTLDSGDKLRIVVFGQDGITNSYMVDAGGNINMPLVGSLPARGYSTQQLSRAITERLKQGYVREPHVTVEIEAYRPFFILGEVTNPGQYPYVANMTVETAIAIAGGFAPRADKSKVELTRNTPGQQMRGNVPLSTPLNPGDTIMIPERWF